jgi:hypothetical protein
MTAEPQWWWLAAVAAYPSLMNSVPGEQPSAAQDPMAPGGQLPQPPTPVEAGEPADRHRDAVDQRDCRVEPTWVSGC